MPAKSAKTTSESDGFSAAERAAIKGRAAELRAEGKKGAKKADALQAVLDSIAEMAPQDRALAERVHVTVTGTTPELTPKTWYGMPAYANADGKIVVFFQDAGKVQLPVLDPGLPGRGQPRRRRHVAGGLRAPTVEPRSRRENYRAGQGRDLLTVAATARRARFVLADSGIILSTRHHDLPCHSSERSLPSCHGVTDRTESGRRVRFGDGTHGSGLNRRGDRVIELRPEAALAAL